MVRRVANPSSHASDTKRDQLEVLVTHNHIAEPVRSPQLTAPPHRASRTFGFAQLITCRTTSSRDKYTARCSPVSYMTS